ncbi:hypothetical protein HDU96_008123 [Phlyctochytrium bullatum]|nr:hypothetical protein HDU96_008123 [Phlyctochytrium bullatum]
MLFTKAAWTAAIAVGLAAQCALANVFGEGLIKQKLNQKIDSLLEEGEEFTSFAAPASTAAAAVPTVVTSFFNQTLDHFAANPSASGTWSQKYFTMDFYYKAGGPIILYIEGESPANPRRLTSTRMYLQNLAKTYNGLLVALEHRYYSPDSTPTPDISVPNLKYLDSRQAIQDGVKFIKWFREDRKVPACTKVIGVGGSYPGNMAAYYRIKHPETFFAAHASSAPVRAEEDFRQYSKAVRLGIANPVANGSPTCSENWRRAVRQFDLALEKDFNKTRHEFGFDGVFNRGDVASAVTTILAGGIQYGPNFSPFGGDVDSDLIGSVCQKDFFPAFKNPNATDAELYAALKGWTNLYQISNGLEPNNPESTYSWNAEYYRGVTDPSDPRANTYLWVWQTCNEFGFFQTAEPAYSKFVDKEYFRFICETIYGPEHKIPDTAATTAYWGEVDSMRSERLIWGNGQVDPWSYLSVQHRRTRGTEFVFWHDTFHCFDLYAPGALPGETEVLAQVKTQVWEAWKTILAQDECPAFVAATTKA